MNELENLRVEIDKVDKEILPLFLKRMELCGKVAEFKRKTGMEIFDPIRERQVLDNKMQLLDSPDMADEVYEFFNSMMCISRVRQGKFLRETAENKSCREVLEKSVLPVQNPQIVYFGNEGAYSEAAAIEYFGKDCEMIYATTFDEAFEVLGGGDVDYAVLPIENSSTGTIAKVVDLLIKYRFSIVGEVCIPIRHCLVGVPGAKLSDIRKIYSHEQALLQCGEFLKDLKGVECKDYYSTAISARTVAESGDKAMAAIASAINAELYGLDIIAEEINDNKGNTTRFAIIARQPEVTEECDKISIAFGLKHESGQLHRILSIFASNDLNVLKLESRPIADKPFEYRFFVDFSGRLLDDRVCSALETVANETRDFTILGTYKSHSAS